MSDRPRKPSVPFSMSGNRPTEPRKSLPAPKPEPEDDPADEPAPFASETTPEGNALPTPIRLYRRQRDRLDALRRSLAPGVNLSRSAAIRFLIDHWPK